MRTIELATGDIDLIGQLAGAPYMVDPWMLFAVGDHVISNVNDYVVGMTGPDRQITQLARHHYALLTFDDTSVWVNANLSGAMGTSVLQRLRLDGTVADRTVVPAIAQPRAGITDGVLLSVSADQQLAWIDCAADLTCYIVIGTLDDPDQVRMPIAANEATTGDVGLPLGRFSPDGRHLALPLLRFAVDSRNMMNARGAVAIVDTATGSEVT